MWLLKCFKSSVQCHMVAEMFWLVARVLLGGFKGIVLWLLRCPVWCTLQCSCYGFVGYCQGVAMWLLKCSKCSGQCYFVAGWWLVYF